MTAAAIGAAVLSALGQVGLAAIELIVSHALSEDQAKKADQRAAHERRVQGIFDAIKARFGITYDQLNQLASKLDIRLSQLKDATRGSARLSKASEIAREYISMYPGLNDKVNQAKNQIQNSMNNIDAKAAARSSQIENREDVSGMDILSDVEPEIANVNKTVNDINTSLSGTKVDNQPAQIETSLTQGISDIKSPNQKNEKTQEIITELQEREPFWKPGADQIKEDMKDMFSKKGN